MLSLCPSACCLQIAITCLFPLAKILLKEHFMTPGLFHFQNDIIILSRCLLVILPSPYSCRIPPPANLMPSLREFRRQSYNYTNYMNAATCWYFGERGKLVSKDWTLFHKLFTTQTWPFLCLLSCIESSSLAANGRTKKSWVDHLFS